MPTSFRLPSRGRWRGPLAGIAIATGSLAAQGKPVLAPPAELRGLDQYIERTRADWGIPGVAIAVVKNDSVIWARGFGVTRQGDTTRVGPSTMFAIGSISKSFTAAALGLLVDDRKLTWDDRVVDRLPGFHLADSAVTAEVRIRDLLSHRTGLPGENLLFWGSNLSRTDILARARFIPIRWPLRTHYEYQNIMFIAAGEIIPAVSGRSWDETVTHRIFQPLGMSRSSSGVTGLARFTDVASPHALVGGRLQPIPWLNLDNAGAAGSIVSSVTDMAQYVRWHLGKGAYRGKRLLSERTLADMYAPQIEIPKEGMYSALFPEPGTVSYGLAWMTHDYHGHRVVEHGGQTDGMHAQVAMMPDLDLGVVVLTNTVLFGYPAAIGYRVFDHFLGRAPRDWSAEIKGKLAGMNAGDRPASRPTTVTPPTVPLAEVAGRYRHPLYGDAVIVRGGGGAELTLLGRTVAMAHWSGDTYQPGWGQYDALIRAILPQLTIVRNQRGAVRAIRFDAVGDFERVGS